MAKRSTQKAAIYCRISRDPEGLRHGVERQLEDCEALAMKQGLNVVARYTDNDIGASSLSKKARPQYAAMLDAARNHEFEVIVAYSNSRLTRRLMELEDLIRLHDDHGTKVKTVVSGEDNLSTADGRMVARIKASVDAAEAERIGERLRRGGVQKAQRGDVNRGRRTFGWNEDKTTLHPTEAPLVRQAVEDVLGGKALRKIAREWDDAGYVTTFGNSWTHTNLRRLLLLPRLVGLQTYHGEILLDASGEPVRGQWEPLLDRDTWDRLQALLRSRVKAGRRPEARRYLLSGLVRCSRCGSRMWGSATPTGYSYFCDTDILDHSISIQGPRTDEFIIELAQARLAEEPLEAAPTPQPNPGVERLDQIPGLISELMAAFSAGTLSGAVAFPQIEALEAERSTLQAQRQQHLASLSNIIKVDASDLGTADGDRQRTVLNSLFEAIVISPAERRGAPWTPDRIRAVWKAAT